MNDAEKFWNERLIQLRRLKGLKPMSMEEAEEALKKLSVESASDEEIDSIVHAISSGEIPGPEIHPPVDWTPDCNFSEIDCEAVLFRGEGEGSPETDQLEDELLKELLDDDQPEDDPA